MARAKDATTQDDSHIGLAKVTLKSDKMQKVKNSSEDMQYGLRQKLKFANKMTLKLGDECDEIDGELRMPSAKDR